MLTLPTIPKPVAPPTAQRCVNERGFSLHAEVRLEPDGVFIVDLESANGTMINGKALEPQRPALLHHGDIVQLGRLRTQLISRFRSER